MSEEITQEYLRRIFNYDPETGVFVRRYRADRNPMWNGRNANKEVGVKANGYLKIALDYKEYMAHRLAWIYMTGEIPYRVDHINGQRGDNRFSNLRSCSQSQNGMNRGKQKNNTTGLKGVHFKKNRGTYTASIKANGKQTHLGSFDCPAAAHFSYIIAADKLHGEYARYA